MAFFIIITLLTVAVLVDVLTQTEHNHISKMGWFIVVLLFPIVGSLVWLLAGRVWAPMPNLGSFGDPRRSAAEPSFRTTEQELAALDAEIAFHEKQARLERLEAEVAEKRKRAQG